MHRRAWSASSLTLICCAVFSTGWRKISMRRSRERTVREIMMGSPVTLKPDDTLRLANDVISLGRVRHIPIVEDGRLVGVLSERDLIGTAANRIFGLKQKTRSALLKTLLIKDNMKKRVLTVEPDTNIKD